MKSPITEIETDGTDGNMIVETVYKSRFGARAIALALVLVAHIATYQFLGATDGRSITIDPNDPLIGSRGVTADIIYLANQSGNLKRRNAKGRALLAQPDNHTSKSHDVLRSGVSQPEGLLPTHENPSPFYKLNELTTKPQVLGSLTESLLTVTSDAGEIVDVRLFIDEFGDVVDVRIEDANQSPEHLSSLSPLIKQLLMAKFAPGKRFHGAVKSQMRIQIDLAPIHSDLF